VDPSLITLDRRRGELDDGAVEMLVSDFLDFEQFLNQCRGTLDLLDESCDESSPLVLALLDVYRRKVVPRRPRDHIYIFSKGSSIWHMSVDSGIGVVRVENGPERECGDGPWSRACLLNLYGEIFANMTKMNVPAKAANKVGPRATADGQKDGNIEGKQLRKRHQNSRKSKHARDSNFCDKKLTLNFIHDYKGMRCNC